MFDYKTYQKEEKLTRGGLASWIPDETRDGVKDGKQESSRQSSQESSP